MHSQGHPCLYDRIFLKGRLSEKHNCTKCKNPFFNSKRFCLMSGWSTFQMVNPPGYRIGPPVWKSDPANHKQTLGFSDNAPMTCLQQLQYLSTSEMIPSHVGQSDNMFRFNVKTYQWQRKWMLLILRHLQLARFFCVQSLALPPNGRPWNGAILGAGHVNFEVSGKSSMLSRNANENISKRF